MCESVESNFNVDPVTIDYVELNIDDNGSSTPPASSTATACTFATQLVLPVTTGPLQPVHHRVLIPHDQTAELAPHRFLLFSILIASICGVVNIFTLCCSIPAIVYSFLVRPHASRYITN